MKYLFFSFTLISVISCATNNDEKIIDENSTESIGTTIKNEEYTVLSVQNPDQSWGYQIMKDGKFVIDQKNIPAIQGNKGFRTKADAEKTGNFIVKKIKNGSFPPTVSVDELDSLGVLSD